MSETLLAIIITAIISPLSLKTLEFLFSLFGKTKQKEAEKLSQQEAHIASLEKRIDEMRDMHAREMSGLRESFNRDIDALRNENIKLQILVAENAVKLTLKDETIARLSKRTNNKAN